MMNKEDAYAGIRREWRVQWREMEVNKVLEQAGWGADFDKFVVQISQDYPELRIRMGRKFAFRPPRTVIIGVQPARDEATERAKMRFLHEMGHFLSGHYRYETDPERIKIEREAWDKGKKIAEEYGVEMDEAFIEEELTTYREWLHQRSKCRKCGLTRYQTRNGEYHCPGCENYA